MVLGSSSLPHSSILLVISGPSGTGKSSIVRSICAADPNAVISVSATTRPPRPGEEDGREYFFVSQDIFDEMAREGQLLEKARVHDRSYGTPCEPILKAQAVGQDVLFDIDYQGMQQIKAAVPDHVVSIFILPPSYQALRERMYNRSQNTPEEIERRMQQATLEIAHWQYYDYVVVNEVLPETIAQVHGILKAERLRRTRRSAVIKTLFP